MHRFKRCLALLMHWRCAGRVSAELAALRKMANASPDNTLLNLVYLPEAEAAQALTQHRPQSVAELLESTHPMRLPPSRPLSKLRRCWLSIVPLTL